MQALDVHAVNLRSLHPACLARITKYLSGRDIVALSIATRLWLITPPLKYEDTLDFEMCQIEQLLKHYGAHLTAFTIDDRYHDDTEIYEMHHVLAKYCLNTTDIDISYSPTNKYIEYCILKLKDLTNLESLQLEGPILTPPIVSHLSDFECLPQLRELKIACTLGDIVDLSRIISQCKELRVLHIQTWIFWRRDMLQQCTKLEELYVAETERRIKVNNGSAAWLVYPQRMLDRRYSLFGYLPQTLRRLHLESIDHFTETDLRGLAQLPLLQHLTLKHFICVQVLPGIPWDLESIFTAGVFSHIEEIYFEGFHGFPCEYILLHLVRNCPTLSTMRLNTVTMHTLKYIVEIMRSRHQLEQSNIIKLYLIAEDLEELNNDHPDYYDFARTGYIELVDPFEDFWGVRN